MMRPESSRKAALQLFVMGCAMMADSGAGAANPVGTLDDRVNVYRLTCVVPFFDGKSESEAIETVAASPDAEDMLSRLAKSAPANWRPLSDRDIPIQKRLQGAIGLLGMAISHGSPYEKQVAAAYVALYLPVPQSDACRRPEGLREFLDSHDFWAAPAAEH